MGEELKHRKIVYYAAAYFTNINYLIVLILLVFYTEFDKDPYSAIIIWAIPAAISVIASIFIIRDNLENQKSKEQGLIKLGIAHFPSLLGLVGSISYIYL